MPRHLTLFWRQSDPNPCKRKARRVHIFLYSEGSFRYSYSRSPAKYTSTYFPHKLWGTKSTLGLSELDLMTTSFQCLSMRPPCIVRKTRTLAGCNTGIRMSVSYIPTHTNHTSIDVGPLRWIFVLVNWQAALFHRGLVGVIISHVQGCQDSLDQTSLSQMDCSIWFLGNKNSQKSSNITFNFQTHVIFLQGFISF
jgi:hypothetical protein